MIFNGLFFCQKIVTKMLGKSKIYSYIYYVINDKDMNIKQFYLEAFPTDELGVEISSEANFESLWIVIRGGLFYEYIGVFDSVIRERIFEKFSELSGHNYDYIYQEWLNS